MFARTAGILALSVLAVGCTSYADSPETADAAPRECFFLSQVDGYTHAGRNKIRVSTGPSKVYEFETLGSCPELRDAETMGFDPAGSGTICKGIDVDLIVPSTIGPRRCAVKMIRRVEMDEK